MHIKVETIVLTSLLIFYSDSQNIFVEENDPFIYFTCPANISVTTLTLNNASLNQQIIAACNSPMCNDYNIGATNYMNGTDYIFKFNASHLAPLRSLTKVQCVYDGKANFQYDIKVYAKPQNVYCDIPQLTSNNTVVSLTCTTQKVYPNAKCEVNLLNKDSSIAGNTYITNSPSDAGYFRGICVWNSSIESFTSGNYHFNVSFSANLIGIISSVNVFPTPFINLFFPVPILSSECHNSSNITDHYIKPGATVDCLCYLDFIGYPAGIVKWYNSLMQEVDNISNTTANTLHISPSTENMVFQCSGINSLKNGKKSINYSVEYAKGPSQCDVKPINSAQKVFDMCYNYYINLSIACSVNKSDVNPGIRSIIHINSSQSNYLTSVTHVNEYRTTYETSISVPGSIQLKCDVQNLIFTDINRTCHNTESLIIIAPPRSAPTLSVTPSAKEDKVIVQENKIYVVECSVPDGVPLVSNVILSCGNITNFNQSVNHLKFSVTFSRNQSEQNCTCKAQHISGCYFENTTQMQLNVTYGSQIKNFKVENTLDTENGTLLKFVCDADGNPPPLLTILKDKASLCQNISGYHVHFEKQVMCKDSGIYECQAGNKLLSNGEEMISKKNVTVNVKCLLQLNNPEDTAKEFSLEIGESFLYNFTIYGFPPPSNFKVLKSDLAIDNVDVTFIPKELPYSIVELKKSNFTKTDFGNYTLLIYQNGTESLRYSFSLNEDGKPKEKDNNDDESFLAAAVCGGIAAGIFVVFILIILAFICKKGYFHRYRRFHDSKRTTSLDLTNGDIYVIKGQIKDKLNMMKGKQSENYKNYKDIIPTITTATAVPKNMYRPEVKPKPNVKNGATYYNFVEPIVSEELNMSDKKDLLDENIYVNQGFSS